ncbi:hypothetical protein WG907_11225 [Sphingobium sp. AN558]|uniref:hypothetical protein n=1 Tax=Sphingobium sp. AN558 TaxID=3133442 RepID=UPI0030C4FB5E
MIRTLLLFGGAAFIGGKLQKGSKGHSVALNDKSTGASDHSAPDKVSQQGHVPVDLLVDEHPDGKARADEHFRPDPTGAIAPEDREAFRPVTAPAPHDPPGR